MLRSASASRIEGGDSSASFISVAKRELPVGGVVLHHPRRAPRESRVGDSDFELARESTQSRRHVVETVAIEI